MAIISSIVFTKKDLTGNNWVETWLLWEFTQAGYTPGGENINLTPYFSRVEMAQAQSVSGAIEFTARHNAADLPGNAGSGRVQLMRVVSGAGNFIEVVSGAAVSGARAYIHALGY